MQQIVDQAKLYKSLSEKRVMGINEILSALDFVADYIKKNKYPLYGGMAIDFSLKVIGHEGIYTDAVMPDYDFISPENIKTSLELKALMENDFEGVDAINGMHLTSRRVRINKFNYVADISFYPEPYFSNIPMNSYQGFTFLHIDYQRIDFHRSLSFLYEGSPGRENFRNRLEKDIKRLNLIEKEIPISAHKIKPINTKGLLLEHFNKPQKIAMLNRTKVCYAGFAAIIMFSQQNPEIFGDLALTWDSKVPDPLEIFLDDYEYFKPDDKSQFYEKTVDIYPEAAVRDGVVHFYNYGHLIAANKIGENYVVNIHFICASLLFKYFMLGNEIYLKYYRVMLKLIGTNKFPYNVNGYYYGTVNMNFTFMYGEKEDDCGVKGVKFQPRPKFGDKNMAVENYITYETGGGKKDKIRRKNYECDV